MRKIVRRRVLETGFGIIAGSMSGTISGVATFVIVKEMDMPPHKLMADKSKSSKVIPTPLRVGVGLRRPTIVDGSPLI